MSPGPTDIAVFVHACLHGGPGDRGRERQASKKDLFSLASLAAGNKRNNPQLLTSHIFPQEGSAAVLDVALQDVRARAASGIELLDRFRIAQPVSSGSRVCARAAASHQIITPLSR